MAKGRKSPTLKKPEVTVDAEVRERGCAGARAARGGGGGVLLHRPPHAACMAAHCCRARLLHPSATMDDPLSRPVLRLAPRPDRGTGDWPQVRGQQALCGQGVWQGYRPVRCGAQGAARRRPGARRPAVQQGRLLLRSEQVWARPAAPAGARGHAQAAQAVLVLPRRPRQPQLPPAAAAAACAHACARM